MSVSSVRPGRAFPLRRGVDVPAAAVGFAAAEAGLAAGAFSDLAMAAATVERTTAGSKSQGLMSGGTKFTEVIFSCLVFTATSASDGSAACGTFVRNTPLVAAAMSPKFRTIVWGSSSLTIAVTTQRWRAIRS